MSFQLANPGPGEDVPRIVERTVAAAQSFLEGALLLIDGSNNAAECGADPAAIAGVAISAYGADTTGFVRTGEKEFPPGKMQIIAALGREFTARYVGTLPAADGALYGVVKDSDGYWKVDFTETVNPRLKLVNRRTASPENVARVTVKFLDANVQII